MSIYLLANSSVKKRDDLGCLTFAQFVYKSADDFLINHNFKKYPIKKIYCGCYKKYYSYLKKRT